MQRQMGPRPKPSQRIRSTRGAVAALSALAACATLVAGCGSSGSASPGGDPATLIPASSPFYAAAVLRPSGTLKANVDSASQKLLRVKDPAARIQALLAPALGRVGLDYKRDVAPWLGAHAGLFLNSLGGATPDGAAVIATSDAAKARSTLMRAAARTSGAAPVTHSYRGVSYELAGTTAEGIVGTFAVIGSEAGLRSVIDVRDGANSLAADPTYQSSLAGVPKDLSLATVYAQPRALLAAAVQAAGTQPRTAKQTGEIALLQRLGRVIGSNGIVAALTVADHAIGVQASSNGSQPSTAGGGGGSTLAGLPADSWLALGAGDIGTALTRDLATLQSISRAGHGQLRIGGALASLRGFDLQRDLLSWAGNLGLFVRGTGLTDLGAAIVITSKNRAASRAAVPRIAALIQAALGKGSTAKRLVLPGVDAGVAVTPASIPIAIDVVNAGARFVIGLGDASVSAALHPAKRFSSSAIYAAASSTLGAGVRPVFVLDFASALTLLNNLGQGSNSSLTRIAPYLHALTSVSVGVGHSGTRTLVRAVLGLR